MTAADILARTLRDAGITRMFGLPGGEILDFVEAARRAGIEFLLTRHEGAAGFMADVTGQLSGVPGVCVSTLGPGAVNMSLGVANAYLDRSPVIAITACHARAAERFATHQNLDLNAVYRPFTKLALRLDGIDTRRKVQKAIDVALAPRCGPVHIALPSDIARSEDRSASAITEDAYVGRGFSADTALMEDVYVGRGLSPGACADGPADVRSGEANGVAALLARALRPVAILGLDLDPIVHRAPVRAFVEALGLPVFVTPKAKGIFPEDHPQFCGVCAGVSGDAVVLDFFDRADLLVGIGFEPVESDKLWHKTMPLVSIGPLSIAAGEFRPLAEAVGDVPRLLVDLQRCATPARWTLDDCARFRADMERVLRPSTPPTGLSGFEITRRLRERFPRDTIITTDVGSVKMVTTQAWTTYEPGTFLESNGLSAMSYALPAAMAARLLHPDRPVLCTIGDGGMGMTLAEIETCVRERLHFVTVVFNDSSLSLIDMAQRRRGYPACGVRYGPVDFAAAAAAMGAWSRRVDTMEALDAAIGEAMTVDRPVVIDAVVDPSEYAQQTAAHMKR